MTPVPRSWQKRSWWIAAVLVCVSPSLAGAITLALWELDHRGLVRIGPFGTPIFTGNAFLAIAGAAIGGVTAPVPRWGRLLLAVVCATLAAVTYVAFHLLGAAAILGP